MPEQVPNEELDGITELEDGSAVVDLEEESAPPASAFGENLAETLPDFTLNEIASSLIDLIEKDQKAREERDKQQEEGIRRTGLGADAPGGATFEGASKVVHPVLAEGCVDFSARAIKELFPANGPVKTKVIGELDTAKLEKAKKKRDFLNFYITRRMPEYRSEKEVLLTQLPLGGSEYEKFWFDGKRVRMGFTPIDKVLLPYSANSFYEAQRITFLRDVTEEQVELDVKSKFYKDVFDLSGQMVEETASQHATNKVEGKTESGYNEDGMRIVYETACLWEVEEGKGKLPYVIHIDEPTSKVCAIYRNWKESDPDQERLDWWVENKFIPWRGAYGIGLPHLIGGLSAALTGALRALLDSAHINTTPTAVKLKGGRSSGENITVDPTGVTEMENVAGVDDIRKLIMPMPFNQPSPVLFQLLDWITAQAKGVVATAEEKIADAGANMPVGTTLALIEQGSQVFSSIHARLHEAQRKGLQIICRLLADYPEHALADMGRFEIVPQDLLESDDIEPVSDPNIFSETQRFAQMQAAMQLAAGDAQDPSIPWNKIAMRHRMLELLRIDGADEWLPKPKPPVTADPVTENISIMQGSEIKAAIIQDHMAHIKTHLMFIMQPMIAQSDGADPKALSMLLAHIQEHLLLSYQHECMTAIQIISQQHPELSPDQAAAQAAQAATKAVEQIDAQLMPVIKQAADIVKSKVPPPQMDPAIKATYDVAMADIKRKTDVDQAGLKLKQEDLQASTSLEAQKAQLEPMLQKMQQQFDGQLEMMRQTFEERLNQSKQQVELMKNDADNKQHQMTELLKNRDDNETAIQTKLLELQGQVQSMPQQAEQPDFSPMFKQMQDMLGQIEKAKTNDALQTTMEGLRAVMTGINAPTELIRDPLTGKAKGARKVLS